MIGYFNYCRVYLLVNQPAWYLWERGTQQSVRRCQFRDVTPLACSVSNCLLTGGLYTRLR